MANYLDSNGLARFKSNCDTAYTNVIEDVQVNGTSLTVTDKAVNIDLTNYATKFDISAVYKAMGTVSTYANLPTLTNTDADIGKVYNVTTADTAHGVKAGDNLLWTGTSWDNLGGNVDLSEYSTTVQISAGYVAKEVGKGLSANDFTNAYKAVLDGLSGLDGSAVPDEVVSTASIDALFV